MNVSKSQVADLILLTAEVEAAEKRIAAELTEIKIAEKKIAAILNVAKSGLETSGREQQKRHGVLFRLVAKPGKTPWRQVCEEIKGAEWCELRAAETPPTKKVEFEILPTKE